MNKPDFSQSIKQLYFNALASFLSVLVNQKILRNYNWILRIYNRSLEINSSMNTYATGSVDWFEIIEHRYGGLVQNVQRNKVSRHDKRLAAEIQKGGMTGGDRMSRVMHNYAPIYSHYLKDFVNKNNMTLIEAGILTGIGLAIWSEFLKDSDGCRLIGLDIDLQHTANNIPNLRDRGAFERYTPELYEFDQLNEIDANKQILGDILKEDKVDIVIDDGLHTEEAILNNFASMLPYLNDKFVYFIEDNKTVHKAIAELYPDHNIFSQGEMTVVYR